MKKKLNIILIPDQKGKMLNFEISYFNLFLIALCFIAVLALPFVYVMNNYIPQQAELSEFKNLTDSEKLIRLSSMAAKNSRLIKQIELLSGIGKEDLETFFGARGGAEIFEGNVQSQPLNEIISQTEQTSQKAEKLHGFLEEKQKIFQSIPTIWPCEGWVSSSFGMRNSPFTGKPEMHYGIDIVNFDGTPVRASASGKVIFSGYNGGYGNTVTIKHEYGFSTRYAHLSSMTVKKNQAVKKNQIIGYMGNTGVSTGTHLHYEVRINDEAVDPSNFMVN